jgi:hypothetical protein
MCFAGQLGGCLTEVGPHYDWFNESVIPAVRNVAPYRGGTAFYFLSGVILPLRKPLPAPPSGAIMKPR